MFHWERNSIEFVLNPGNQLFLLHRTNFLTLSLSSLLGCYFSVPFVFYSFLTYLLLVMSSTFLHVCSISPKRAVCLLNIFSSRLFLALLFSSTHRGVLRVFFFDNILYRVNKTNHR